MNGVIIVVEKIQRYIYKRIDERLVEAQHDGKTLKDIVNASAVISENIFKKIEEKFSINTDKFNEVLLSVSGKTIFLTYLNKEIIIRKLKELHKEIYFEYGGDIQLSYGYFEVLNEDKMEILKKANETLDEEKNKNTNIKNLSEYIFEFQELEIPSTEMKFDKTEIFASDMDALVLEDENQVKDSTDGKIAIVKADINNMGKIFSEIKCYQEYKNLSDLLKKKISKKNFEDFIKNCKTSDLKGKVFPFYIEGDDIFYAVQISSLLSSIDLLHKMIKEINKEIKKYKNQEKIELGIAVGVIFTNNHQPIRYYHEMVEKELAIAKKHMKINKVDRVELGISLAGNLFFGYRGILGNLEQDGFSKFSQEVEELKWLRNQNIFSNSFIYKLLHILETDKENGKEEMKQQLRHLLYFLIPDTKKTEKSMYDLFFKCYLLSQVVEDKVNKNCKSFGKLFDEEKINSILIPKLKLILLLIDDRFINLEEKSNFGFKYIIRNENEIKKINNVMSVMFTKPLHYIINSFSSEEYNIEKIFIEKKFIAKDFGEDKKITKKITIYRKVPLNITMLFRIKKLIEQKKYDLVERLIINYFEQNRDYFKTLKKEREEENKIEYRKDFDSQKFIKYFKKIRDNHKTDWLDNLILFYKYDEQRIQKKEINKYWKNFKEVVKFNEGE